MIGACLFQVLECGCSLTEDDQVRVRLLVKFGAKTDPGIVDLIVTQPEDLKLFGPQSIGKYFNICLSKFDDVIQPTVDRKSVLH